MHWYPYLFSVIEIDILKFMSFFCMYFCFIILILSIWYNDNKLSSILSILCMLFCFIILYVIIWCKKNNLIIYVICILKVFLFFFFHECLLSHLVIHHTKKINKYSRRLGLCIHTFICISVGKKKKKLCEWVGFIKIRCDTFLWALIRSPL